MKVISNGIRIHVEERGQGDLPLVFLHYWGGSLRTWRHVVDALSPTHRTVALDQRGWGQSDAPLSGYTLAELAADAEGVIEALNLTRYVLVGHSMGGKVAQLIASRRPSGLAGLVLVAPSPPEATLLPAGVQQMMTAAYDSAESVGLTIDHVLAGSPLDAEDRAQVIEDSLLGAAPAKFAWPRDIMRADITEKVTAIDVPILVIAGELDQVDSVDTLTSRLLPYLPHADMRVLPGTGHLSPLESPREMATLIQDFVHGVVAMRYVS